MRNWLPGFAGTTLLVASALAPRLSSQVPQPAAGPESRRATDAQTVVIENAPTDHAVPILKERLDEYFKEMDAKKLQTLRMIEGGKFNVNIRRITGAETALIHPATIDVWVVLQGSGTITTGGKIESGKIVGGQSHLLKIGDVEFIPANLPHGVSGVNGSITWLNVRWDTDWPAGAELGAGTPPGGGASVLPLEHAPTDHSLAIPGPTLDRYRDDMKAKHQSLLRMSEGGHFNVNIRRIDGPSVELHPITVDTWVVLEGSGTAVTDFKTQDGKMVPGTGVSQPLNAGDVMFVPANLTHGFSAVNGAVSWLNIRWDVNWAK